MQYNYIVERDGEFYLGTEDGEKHVRMCERGERHSYAPDSIGAVIRHLTLGLGWRKNGANGIHLLRNSAPSFARYISEHSNH